MGDCDVVARSVILVVYRYLARCRASGVSGGVARWLSTVVSPFMARFGPLGVTAVVTRLFVVGVSDRLARWLRLVVWMSMAR